MSVQTTPATPAGVPVIRIDWDFGWYPSPVQGLANWQKELSQIPPQPSIL